MNVCTGPMRAAMRRTPRRAGLPRPRRGRLAALVVLTIVPLRACTTAPAAPSAEPVVGPPRSLAMPPSFSMPSTTAIASAPAVRAVPADQASAATTAVPIVLSASDDTRSPTHRSGLYCGPTAQNVRQKPVAMAALLDSVHVRELRPPCTSRYGRRSTGALIFANQMVVDNAIVADNRSLLAFSLAHGYQFYVDDARFLSGDPTLVSAAFDAYEDFLYSGSFGIEITDEPTVANVQQTLTMIEQTGHELERRNARSGQTLALTAILRPIVNFVPGSDAVIAALRHALGPQARFSVDAYSTDTTIWDRFMALFGIVGMRAEAGTRYDIQLTIPMSRWIDASTRAPRSPDVTSESLLAYLSLATRYERAGVGEIMLFTGFRADDNIYDDHFEGSLAEPKVLVSVEAALATYWGLPSP